jgi:hypothetical protein
MVIRVGFGVRQTMLTIDDLIEGLRSKERTLANSSSSVQDELPETFAPSKQLQGCIECAVARLEACERELEVWRKTGAERPPEIKFEDWTLTTAIAESFVATGKFCSPYWTPEQLSMVFGHPILHSRLQFISGKALIKLRRQEIQRLKAKQENAQV